MNKTITVNISGMVFYIEEPGFLILKNYLDRLKTIFSNTPGGDDIIADIEARIAELFKAKLTTEQQVIHESDVTEVIGILGRPEDFADTAEETDYAYDVPKGKKSKRMYRDTENEVLAGVAAGLSHYFGWDVVVFRLAFVLLTIFGGSGIPIYIILWIVLPEAKTTADKLNMTGQPVNLDSIKRKVEEELKTAEERLKNAGKKADKAFRSSNFRNGVENVGSTLGKIIETIVGIWLLLTGIAIIVLPIIGYVVGDVVMGINDSPFNMAFHIFPDAASMWLIFLGGFLIWIIPAIVIMYLGMRLLGVQSKPHASVGWLLTSLFIAGVISAIIGGVNTGKKFSRNGEVETKHTISQTATDTLYVHVMDDAVFKYPNVRHNDVEFFDLFKIENDSIYVAQPIHMGVEDLPADAMPYLRIVKNSQGETYDDAILKAENISYAFRSDSTGIWLGSHLIFPEKDQIRGQHIEITLGLPEGKVVCFDKNIHRLYNRRSVDEGYFMRKAEEWTEAR